MGRGGKLGNSQREFTTTKEGQAMARAQQQGDVKKEINNHKQGRSGSGTPTRTGPAVSGVKSNGPKPGRK